jgi:biotin transport system substrate-specific component
MAAAVATTHRPIVEFALPASGAARWAGRLGFAVAGALVLWASAKISVPFYPVPMSLQTLAVMLIAGAYGWRLGLATVVLYLGSGMAGLPVFAGTPPQIASPLYLLGPTGGFLIGFAAVAVFVGWFVERGAARSALTLFPVMLVGDAVLFALGFLWLAFFAQLSSGAAGLGIEAAWNGGVMPFLLGDLFKVAVASLLIPAVGRLVQR